MMAISKRYPAGAKFLAITLALFALPIFRTTAAPLDEWCAQVKLPSSIVICGDPELRTLAVERQQAFDSAEAGLNPDQQRELLADQNSWVRSYATSCGVPRDAPAPNPVPASVKACFKRAGEARIAYLRAYGSGLRRSAPQPVPAVPTPSSADAAVDDLGDLIRLWSEANNKCRGGSGDAATDAACARRKTYGDKLDELGWCYGEEGQFGYQFEWHKCDRNSFHSHQDRKNVGPDLADQEREAGTLQYDLKLVERNQTLDTLDARVFQCAYNQTKADLMNGERNYDKIMDYVVGIRSDQIRRGSCGSMFLSVYTFKGIDMTPVEARTHIVGLVKSAINSVLDESR